MSLIIFCPRFLLIFVVCLVSLFGKGAAVAVVFSEVYLNNETLGEKATLLAIVFATHFLPGLLLGIISCWHKDLAKTIIAHPSVVLMPAFTGYSFKKEKEKETGEPFLVFSPKITLLNILLSILGIVFHGRSLAPINDEDYIASLPPRVLAPLLTLVSLPLISRQLCCNCTHLNCCCACFSLPQVEYGALLPSQPFTGFVINSKGKLEKEGDEEEEVVELEMTN